MATYTIPDGNWTLALIETIDALQDGDTLIINSDDKAELARRAIARKRSGLKVTVKVQA